MSVYSNLASGAKESHERYVTAVLELLGDRDPYETLRELPDVIEAALEDLDDAALRTPEADGKWSMVEVVQHLADSELVWAYRLRMVVAHDRPQITGYDQDLWANRLHYRSADAAAALEQIRVLRRANLRLLEGLSEAELHRVGCHVERGEESIGHMVRLYAGHDLVHRRQLARIKATILSRRV